MRERAVTLIEVVVAMVLFMILTPLISTLIITQMQEGSAQQDRKETIDALVSGSDILSTHLPMAQLPLIDARGDSLEWAVIGAQGPRYYRIWAECSNGSTKIYWRYREPAINLIPNPNMDGDLSVWVDYDNDGQRDVDGAGELVLPNGSSSYPAWNATTTYSVGDGASSGSNHWISKQSRNTNNPPPASGEDNWWAPVTPERSGIATSESSSPAWKDTNGNGIVDEGEWYNHPDNRPNEYIALTEAEKRQLQQRRNHLVDDEFNPFGWYGQVRGATASDLNMYGGDSIDNHEINPVAPPALRLDGGKLKVAQQPYSPPQPSYTWVTSDIFPAMQGDVFLVGGEMKDNNVADGAPGDLGKPRIEWFWVRIDDSEGIKLIQERSGSIIHKDGAESSWSYALTKPAPQGVDGIVIRLSPGLLSANDGATFDKILLQRWNKTRRVTNAEGHNLYFDGDTPPTNPRYNKDDGDFSPMGPFWWGEEGKSPSVYGTGADATAYPSGANLPSAFGNNDRRSAPQHNILLSEPEDSEGATCSSDQTKVFTYLDADGNDTNEEVRSIEIRYRMSEKAREDTVLTIPLNIAHNQNQEPNESLEVKVAPGGTSVYIPPA